MIEFRCEAKKFAELDENVLEVKCSSRFCGGGPGIVVIHQFDLKGNLLETKRYRDTPAELIEEGR